MGVTQLTIVKIGGKRFYVDEQLKQFRNVNNPHEFMSFSEVDVRYVRPDEPEPPEPDFKVTLKQLERKEILEFDLSYDEGQKVLGLLFQIQNARNVKK